MKYYELRAKGGTALIIIENACIDYPLGTNGTKQLRIDNVQYVPGLAEQFQDLLKKMRSKRLLKNMERQLQGPSWLVLTV